MDEKQSRLDTIRAEIISKNICPELASQATNLVMGRGNIDAEIVFIGEAPGREEDEQGLPFVGRSGKFLDKMLDMAGISQNEVYITNIVKYRPPKNRNPSKTEIADFMPYLEQQLEIINPKIIIALGSFSMRCFMPDEFITKIHGQSFELDFNDKKILLMPIFHPAAIMRDGRKLQPTVDDFMKIPNLINRIKKNDRNVG